MILTEVKPMKLTRHERKIISQINKGEVYDIPSYLRFFGKGHEQSYNMEAIRNKFVEDENGRKYKVLKEGHSLFVSSHSTQYIMGQPIHTPLLIQRKEEDILDDEWTLCEAKFNDKIPLSTFSYDEQEFKLDFQEGVFVADNFKDILTFIRLWSYLRRENLVFEVDKPVSKDEISMLYELVPYSPKKHSAKIKIEWDKSSDDDENTEKLKPVREIHQTVPIRYAEEFMDTKWKMNEDHLMMCREFLGKKMYPTEASHNFAANNYRTPDEVHRNLNSIVAVAALLISILSFFYGLLHPSNTYQPVLDNLTQQINEIQMTLNDISENQLSVESSGMYSEIRELTADIEEIRDTIAEQLSTADTSKE